MTRIRISNKTASYNVGTPNVGVATDYAVENIRDQFARFRPWRSARGNTALILPLSNAEDPHILLIERVNFSRALIRATSGTTNLSSADTQTDTRDFEDILFFEDLALASGSTSFDLRVPITALPSSATYYEIGRLSIASRWRELHTNPSAPFNFEVKRPARASQTPWGQVRPRLEPYLTCSWNWLLTDSADLAVARELGAAEPGAAYIVDYQDLQGVYLMTPRRVQISEDRGDLVRVRINWEQL